MTDATLRKRVVRLLDGARLADDLSRLFLYARDRCDGREAVREIGDFVAHHSERTKGIVTRSAREWAAIAGFKFKYLEKPIDLENLDRLFPAFLTATLNRLDHRFLKESGFPRKLQLQRSVQSILNKLVAKIDGSLTLGDVTKQALNAKEIEHLNILLRFLISKPAFTGEALFDGFRATLRSNGLLQSSEERTFQACSRFVQLYAVTIMHQCKIRLDDTLIGSLEIMLNDGENNDRIVVVLDYPIHDIKKGVSLATPMMTTTLSAHDCCNHELRLIGRLTDVPLEVNQAEQLVGF